MTVNEFESYKVIANKILDLLIEENHSSLKDIKIIYNIIMGFPYCLDQEGQYVYEGKFYSSLKGLLDEAKEEIINRNIIFSNITFTSNTIAKHKFQ